MAQTKAQLLGPVVGDVTMDVNTLSLDAEGNKVGIGTTGATATLHVFEPTEGDAVVQFNSGDNFPTVNRGLVLKAATGPTGYTGSKWIFDAQSSGGRLEFQTASTPRLTIFEDGDIEYKYADADTDAEVGATQLPHGLRIWNTNNTLGRLAGIHFSHGLGGTANAGIFHETTNTASNSTTCLGDLVFYTKNSGVSHMTEKLRITSTGKITQTNFSGIGFHMSGSGDPTLQISDTDGTNQHVMLAHNGGDSYIVTRNNTSHGGFRVYSQNGSETLTRLRIDSGGRVGIGTTTLASSSRLTLFEESGNGQTLEIIAKNAGGVGSQPGIKFTANNGDNIGGIYGDVNSDSLKIQTGGTERLSIDSNGNITLGFAGNSLYFQNGFNNSTARIQNGGGSNNSELKFLVRNAGTESERLRIASNGQVLIGNYATHSSIHGNLEVNGNDGINISNSYRTGTNGVQWRLIPHNGGSGQSPSNLRLYEGTGGTEVINITKTGRIGVNRMAPAFMLDIVGNSSVADSTGSNCIRIVDGAETGHGSHPAKIVAGGAYYHEMQMHSRRFTVHTYDGSSIAERFRVHQNGYVGINDTNPTRAISVRYNDSTAYSASGYNPNGGSIRIFNEQSGSNITAGEIMLGAGSTGTGWAAISCKRPGSQETELNFRVMDSATWNTGLTINKSAFVGIGVDSPAVKLDVKKATAGTIARFYDNGSNGGALYNGAPIMGLSRVSNGSVSLDGLFFQVGWDKNSSDAYNIDETVFAVGNKGVGFGEDDPQVMLHCSKGLGSTTSYKDAQMIRIAGTNGANTMAGIGFGYHTTNPTGSAYPSAWIGAKVSSWTQYVKHDLVFATRSTDTNVEPTERFRITEGNELKQAQDSQYWTYGNFTAGRSAQNASTAPRLAGSIAYGFGYQEAFGTSNGGWSHPYPDAVFGYHTGMRFGGHINYGGCRFYADHPSSNSSVLFSVGNGSYNVVVANTLSKGGGTFRIAHPHPSKKYTHDLQHSFIEGPQCDNLYRGRVDLVDGTASINIDTVSNMTDGTFVLLNRDIQCFTSNETGWTAVKGSVSGNILTITAQDNSCTDTVSWMVIGERQDDKIKSPEMEMTDSDGKLIVEPLTIEESHM